MISVRVHRDRYVDSVVLLSATRAIKESPGVGFATAVMGTPANLAALRDAGVAAGDVEDVAANDIVMVARADDDAAAAAGLEAGDHILFATRTSGGGGGGAAANPATLGAAVGALAGANVAVISVPGGYAALEAHKALSAGLNVLLFSDNVTVEEEVELKDHALAAGRLVMGPGAGTAMLGGCGLGFANVAKRGRIGVVAAAGTGAQEAMALLDRWGEGVTQVIGVGGRDLSEAVAGRSARMAIRAMENDPDTEVILLVSKPPSPDVARAVVAECGSTPLVAALVGVADGTAVPGAEAVSSTLEGGVAHAVRLLGGNPPTQWGTLRADVDGAIAGLSAKRTTVRGLFSGGTLCYEALTLMQPHLGPVWSNTPLDKQFHVPAPAGAHICLDLGEEEYTQGRPHPMIDPEARLELLRALSDEPGIAVVLLDIVLGYGSHDDPAAVLAPACADLAGAADAPRIVVYVLGTDGDPQGLERQRRAFTEAGCVVAPTNARAALAAAAITVRRSDIVETVL